MKAVRIHAPGGPENLKLDDVPEPTPKADQAVVKIDAAGLNYIDVYFRTGQYKSELPLTLGMEAAGTVTAVGADVKDVKVGDKVAYTGIPGAYAQYAAVPGVRLVVLPAGISTKQGAAIMLQGMTAHYLACSTYPLKQGDTCLVHAAAGGVGLLLTQMAKMRGARVLGTVSTDEKAKLAREAGADHVIDYKREDVAAAVMDLTDKAGVDAVIEMDLAANAKLYPGLLHARSQVVVYGTGAPEAPIPAQFLLVNQIAMKWIFVYELTATERDEAVGAITRLMAEKRLIHNVALTLPLGDIVRAHEVVEAGKTPGNVVVTMA